MNGSKVFFNFADGGVLIIYDPTGLFVTESELSYHVVSGNASEIGVDIYLPKSNVVYYRYQEGKSNFNTES